MINYLFETLPEYIAFQILTYTPHPNADMIKKHWHFKNIIKIIKIINEEMIEPENTTGIPYTNFYGWYMYNESPQWGDNVIRETQREYEGSIWYL